MLAFESHGILVHYEVVTTLRDNDDPTYGYTCYRTWATDEDGNQLREDRYRILPGVPKVS